MLYLGDSAASGLSGLPFWNTCRSNVSPPGRVFHGFTFVFYYILGDFLNFNWNFLIFIIFNFIDLLFIVVKYNTKFTTLTIFKCIVL